VNGAVAWFRGLPTAGRAGLVLVMIIVVLGTLVPLVSPYDTSVGDAASLAPPSLAHPFGADQLGRDVFTRSFAAVQLDMLVALVGVVIPLFTGTVIGALAMTSDVGIVRGIVGTFIDGINAFPFLILALGVIAVVGTGVTSVIVAIALTSWARYAKLARTRASIIRDADFVSALRLLGYGRWRIVVRHILPNVFTETFAYGVSDFTLVILTVAALSFLGAGVPPPTPEWGSMMSDGRLFLASAPWLLIGPGIVLTVTAFAISLIGEAMKDQVRA
jgi:peptide/nickel transport system permease protein